LKNTDLEALNSCTSLFLSATAFTNKVQLEMADFVTGAATWRTRRNILVVFDSGLVDALNENMTSSTIPEVHNLSHCRHRRKT